MPRKPSKKKLLSIFEAQYKLTEHAAKAIVEAHAKTLLPETVATHVHMYGICGGLHSVLDKCLCYFFTYGIEFLNPLAIELRVLMCVQNRLGDLEKFKYYYTKDEEKERIKAAKEKAVCEMYAAFGYVP